MGKVKRYMPTIVFCTFVGIMFLMFWVLPKESYSSSEKRYLQEFPKLDTQTFFNGDFEKQYEVYLSDHTAARNFFVGLNSYYDLYTGRNGVTGVYNCANNYLINAPVTGEQLKNGQKSTLVKNAETLAGFVKDNSQKASMMIVPDTGYVMDSVLPFNHYTYKDDAYFSQIKEAVGDSMEFVDLRQTFKEKASSMQIFYNTDHHWTTPGAYLAYTKLSETLGFSPTPETDFDKSTYSGFYGTTYSTSGFWLNNPDSIEVWKNKSFSGNNINVEIKEGTESSTYDSMFFYSHLKEDDKYPVFLDGNHAYEKITNSDCKNGKKLLIIKDSFAHSLVPFLAADYSEIITVDMRYYKEPVSDVLKTEGITDTLIVYSLENLYSSTDINWLS